jgi:hypothetical protein
MNKTFYPVTRTSLPALSSQLWTMTTTKTTAEYQISSDF